MPRQPKPYLHRGWYVTNVGGYRHKLCRESDGVRTAIKALGKLLEEQKERVRPPSRLLVAELIAQYLAGREKEINRFSFMNERRHLTWFAEEHGTKQAAEVTHLDGVKFRVSLQNRISSITKKPLKAATVNHALAVLNQCWNWAIEANLIAAKNPFAKLKKLPKEGRRRIISNAEFQTLMRNSNTHFQWVLLTLRYTSMRPGELRKLAWCMIDWPGKRFVIVQHKTVRTMKQPRPRVIPFPPCIEKLLRFLHRRHGNESVYVFLNTHEQRWLDHSLSMAMLYTRERAGIQPDTNGEQIVLYSNRHTYITAAAKSGANALVIQDLAGHTNPAMTAWYTHLDDPTISEAADKAVAKLKCPDGPPAGPGNRPSGAPGKPPATP